MESNEFTTILKLDCDDLIKQLGLAAGELKRPIAELNKRLDKFEKRIAKLERKGKS